jgi:two-component system, NarL family, response regulator LiaR
MTKREKQIIELIADGLSNKDIAEKLHLSVYNIKSLIHNILEKLALHTRVQIAKYSHNNNEFKTFVDDISLLDD